MKERSCRAHHAAAHGSRWQSSFHIIKFLANGTRASASSRSSPPCAHKKEVSAKASKFLNASNELGKLAMRGGYEKCNRFFNTSYCSFDKGRGCSRFPCGYKTKSDSVRAILATLD